MAAYVITDDPKDEVADVINELNELNVINAVNEIADVDNIIFCSKPFKVTYI